MMKRAARRVVDVHTHLYPASYIAMLKLRTSAPKIVEREGRSFLYLLPGEDAPSHPGNAGRLITSSYWSPDEKLSFMDKSGIDTAVVSLPNPWFDFLGAIDAIPATTASNEELNDIADGRRLFVMATLPVTAGVTACLEELDRVRKLEHMRGVILSTAGVGNCGLDDPALEPLWSALSDSQLPVFIHPHYGIGGEDFGSRYGHSLHLALGFTFETTTHVARLILAGVLDRHPSLKLLLAHAGGTLPFLAGRIDTCVDSDEAISKSLPNPPSYYLKRLYYDAITYHAPGIQCAASFAGTDRLLFGTDHPFSISNPELNYRSYDDAKFTAKEQGQILSNNADILFNLDRAVREEQRVPVACQL